jgi:hypothetical protein
MRARLIVCAAAVFGFVVVPFAVAQAVGGSEDPEATTSALTKKVKKLSKKVKALQAEQGEPRPPSGSAGGDLDGTYPDPSIANGAVDAAKVLNGSLGTSELSHAIPAASVTNSANQSITGGAAFPTLSFDTERYDTANLHSNTTNNSRLTAPVDGIYDVAARINWAAAASGIRTLGIRKNGAVSLTSQVVPGSASVTLNLETTAQVRLQAGEFVTVVAFQDGATNLNVTKTNPDQISPEFAMVWVAPGP